MAIASIGSQVLIVSKAKLRSKEYDIVVAFINWEIFELPGINLEDIVIPVREYSHMPNAADIDSIKNEVIQSLDKESYFEHFIYTLLWLYYFTGMRVMRRLLFIGKM